MLFLFGDYAEMAPRNFSSRLLCSHKTDEETDLSDTLPVVKLLFSSRNMCSYDSYCSKSNSETSSLTEADRVESTNPIKGNKFGNFQETYNWVECESMRFPGKTYFFNLRTQNSTWTRPVSKHVRLQRFTRKSKIYDDDRAADPEIPLMLSSESEKENYDENEENERNNNEIYKNSKILARLYYGTSIDRFSNVDQNQYFNNYFNHFLENLYDKDRSNSDDPFHEIAEKDDATFDEYPVENSSIVVSNFLEVQLCTSESALNIEENIDAISENDSASVEERSVVYSTTSTDEETKENDVCQDHVTLRLKRIKAKYLLKGNVRNGRRRKVAKKRAPLPAKKLSEMKIVREMYGTTTVSYDPVEPELPPGVKRTNLSDSSTSDDDTVRPVASNHSGFWNVVSCVANLSSRSSSSTCSSSSSSCSCSCSCSCSSSTKSSVGSETFVNGRST